MKILDGSRTSEELRQRQDQRSQVQIKGEGAWPQQCWKHDCKYGRSLSSLDELLEQKSRALVQSSSVDASIDKIHISLQCILEVLSILLIDSLSRIL
jgi:hypothetical protein